MSLLKFGAQQSFYIQNNLTEKDSGREKGRKYTKSLRIFFWKIKPWIKF
jgi:hypothetical protein